MSKTRLILGAVLATITAIGICTALPSQSRTQPANASTSDPVRSECPAPTSEGVYFERGYDKTTGEVTCGFSFYHACPYSEGVSADDPMCEKAKPTEQQLERWYPEATTEPTTTTNQCEVK